MTTTPQQRSTTTEATTMDADMLAAKKRQAEFDKRQAHQVAQAIGGVVVAVDPLAADYVDNLRRVGREFAQALQP